MAGATAPTDDLEPLITCPVCKEVYVSPRILPCFHSFCAQCVGKLCAGRGSITCPLCQQSCHTLDIKHDFKTVGLLDVYRSTRAVPATSGEELCEMCHVYEYAWTCFDCQKRMCPSCKTSHDQIPVCESHQVQFTASARDSATSALADVCNEFNDIADTCTNDINHLRQYIQHLQTQAETTAALLKKHEQDIHGAIGDHFSLVKHSADVAIRTELEECRRKIRRLEAVYASQQKEQEKLESACAQEDDACGSTDDAFANSYKAIQMYRDELADLAESQRQLSVCPRTVSQQRLAQTIKGICTLDIKYGANDVTAPQRAAEHRPTKLTDGASKAPDDDMTSCATARAVACSPKAIPGRRASRQSSLSSFLGRHTAQKCIYYFPRAAHVRRLSEVCGEIWVTISSGATKVFSKNGHCLRDIIVYNNATKLVGDSHEFGLKFYQLEAVTECMTGEIVAAVKRTTTSFAASGPVCCQGNPGLAVLYKTGQIKETLAEQQCRDVTTDDSCLYALTTHTPSQVLIFRREDSRWIQTQAVTPSPHLAFGRMIARDGICYLTASFIHNVFKYNALTDQGIQMLGQKDGSGNCDDICEPIVCSADATGNILVSDWSNSHLKILDQLDQWFTLPRSHTDPWDAILDKEGMIWIIKSTKLPSGECNTQALFRIAIHENKVKPQTCRKASKLSRLLANLRKR